MPVTSQTRLPPHAAARRGHRVPQPRPRSAGGGPRGPCDSRLCRSRQGPPTGRSHCRSRRGRPGQPQSVATGSGDGPGSRAAPPAHVGGSQCSSATGSGAQHRSRQVTHRWVDHRAPTCAGEAVPRSEDYLPSSYIFRNQRSPAATRRMSFCRWNRCRMWCVNRS